MESLISVAVVAATLLVSFSGRFQLVSPRERERFIDDLQRRIGAAS